MMMREINNVIIHCADTYPDMDIGAEEIRRWHVDENGWDDIGYNHIIRRSGKIENGRDLDGDGNVLEEIGAHTLGYNRYSIGICLVGGKSREDNGPDFNFTFAQLIALRSLCTTYREQFPGVKFYGHRDLDSRKACPVFDVNSFLTE